MTKKSKIVSATCQVVDTVKYKYIKMPEIDGLKQFITEFAELVNNAGVVTSIYIDFDVSDNTLVYDIRVDNECLNNTVKPNEFIVFLDDEKFSDNGWSVYERIIIIENENNIASVIEDVYRDING